MRFILSPQRLNRLGVVCIEESTATYGLSMNGKIAISFCYVKKLRISGECNDQAYAATAARFHMIRVSQMMNILKGRGRWSGRSARPQTERKSFGVETQTV